MLHAAETPPELAPSDAHVRFGAGAHLVDVREPDEWDAGHVPGARHIPLGALGDHLGSLPLDADVLVVCRSGGRSGVAAAALLRAGYRAINVAGGMRSWQAAGLPIVTDTGLPARVI